MNPQNNSVPGGTPNFDGFGGPNISYESFSEPQPQAPQPVPQQTINVVNANGVVSGRKMVDYMWKRLAYCGLVFSIVFLAGLIAAVAFVGLVSSDKAKLEAEKAASDRALGGIYDILGVGGQEEAVQALSKDAEYINGGDIQKIDKLLTDKYGEYVLDYADSNINFVRINNMFKIVSLGVVRPNGTARAILYARIADGNWKLGGFDSTNVKDPCADSSDEEKIAIKGIVSCAEKDDDEEEKPKEEKPTEPVEKDPDDGDDGEKKPEEGDGTEKEKEDEKDKEKEKDE